MSPIRLGEALQPRQRPVEPLEEEEAIPVAPDWENVLEAIVGRLQPTVHVEPPDLSAIVTAVTSLKQGVTADEIAQAIKATMALAVHSPEPTEALQAVAASLEKLDFRLKGTGVQAYGGATTRLSAPVDIGSLPNVTLDAATLAALETLTVLQGTNPWVIGDGNSSISVDSGNSILDILTTSSANTNRSTVAASSTSVTLITATGARRMLTITNDADKALYIAFKNITVLVTDFDVKIAAGGYYEIPYRYTGQINGVWDALPVGNARLAEFVA